MRIGFDDLCSQDGHSNEHAGTNLRGQPAMDAKRNVAIVELPADREFDTTPMLGLPMFLRAKAAGLRRSVCEESCFARHFGR